VATSSSGSGVTEPEVESGSTSAAGSTSRSWATGSSPQFEGYDALEAFDWEAYRQRYGNIGRLDLILEAEGDTTNRYQLSKQADALMLFYLLSAEELCELFDHLGLTFDPG
jgi:trehalose/maltose hydrolase-like predicted phosphorylase